MYINKFAKNSQIISNGNLCVASWLFREIRDFS